jgi:mannose-6-phosphate isomerase-like protein (cupin superfamily)
MKAVRWDEIPDEEVRPGVRRRGIGTRDVLLVMNECRPGMDLRPHSHEFDQLALIISGEAISHVGEDHNEVGPGSVMLVPAGVEHYIEPTGSEPVLNLDVFAPAREDYLHLLGWMTERLGVEAPAGTA